MAMAQTTNVIMLLSQYDKLLTGSDITLQDVMWTH